VTRRHPPERHGDDPPTAALEFPDRDHSWRIRAGLSAGPPPRPQKRRRRPLVVTGAPGSFGSGLLKSSSARRILKLSAAKTPAKFFATVACAPKPEHFRGSRPFKISLKFRCRGDRR
jgi:hypothetical protein